MDKIYEAIVSCLKGIARTFHASGAVLAAILALLALFAVFALSKLRSRARRDAKRLRALSARLGTEEWGSASDLAAFGESLKGSPALSFGWKRLCASETLTAFDVFGKPEKPAKNVLFASLSAVIVLFSYMIRLFVGGDEAERFGVFALVAAVAVLLFLLLHLISVRQEKKRCAQARNFAEALERALPRSRRVAILGGDPGRVRRATIREVKGEQVDEEAERAESAEQAEKSEKKEKAAGAANAAKATASAKATDPAPEEGTVAVRTENSVDEIIRKINEVRQSGASIQTMQQIAMLLQKEREKKENKTVEQQRRLNEALAELLRAMSRYQK